jgi:uncharacterized protein YgiB involved in biofilm formation
MKRSQSINLARMRKASGVFALKPLALCVATLFAAGCDSPEQQADIFKTLDECKSTYPDLGAQCEMAFNEALHKAQDTAPKYGTLDDCVAEFGADRCVKQEKSDGSSWFMPAMAGFMLARALDDRRYDTAPMFTSSHYGSRYYNRWSTVDGYTYGDYRQGRMSTRVGSDTFKPKPAVTKTISRGGFGSKAAAASNWGSNSKSTSRSSWGG